MINKGIKKYGGTEIRLLWAIGVQVNIKFRLNPCIASAFKILTAEYRLVTREKRMQQDGIKIHLILYREKSHTKEDAWWSNLEIYLMQLIF